MIQITRLDGITKASTVLNLLPHDTPSLPSGVDCIVRIKGIASASMILRLLPSTGGTSTGYIITPDGDILLTPDGNYMESPDYA